MKFLRDLFFVGVKKRGGDSDLKTKAVGRVSFHLSGVQGYGESTAIEVVAGGAMGRQYYVGCELVRLPCETARCPADLDQNTSQGQGIWCVVQHVKPRMQFHRFPKFLRLRWFLASLFLWKPRHDFSRVFPSNMEVANVEPLAGKKLLKIGRPPNRHPSQKQDDSLQDPYCRQDSGKPLYLSLCVQVLALVLAILVTPWGSWLAGSGGRVLGTVLGVFGIGLLGTVLTIIGFCDPLFWRAEWRSLTGQEANRCSRAYKQQTEYSQPLTHGGNVSQKPLDLAWGPVGGLGGMVTKAEQKRIANRRKKRREKWAAVLTLVGLAVGFASLAYVMLAPNPSFYLGIAFLLMAALCLVGAILGYFETGKWKTILVILLAVGIWFAFRWVHSQWETTIRASVLSELSMSMTVPPDETPWDSLITISNNSSFTLSNRQVFCFINMARFAGGTMISVPVSFTRPNEDLSPGGDAQTSGCLRSPGGPRIFTSDPQMACADVTLMTRYTIGASPSVRDEKRLRFVFGYGGQQTWVSQSVNRIGSYCS
jgi:hypothetical protein